MARINRESDRINSKRNQKTNCPVNAHLGYPIYTPKKWYTAPSAGEDEIPFPIQMHRPCHKTGNDHHRVMIS